MNILVCRLHQLTDFCHIFPLSFAQPSLNLRSTFAYPSSHTRLRQLADFPLLKVRWEEL